MNDPRRNLCAWMQWTKTTQVHTWLYSTNKGRGGVSCYGGNNKTNELPGMISFIFVYT